MGESEGGIPGQEMDIRLNYFTDFQSVKEFYKVGPIVDAARQLFTAQPNAVFSGAVQRLYVWKTNQTSRAEKAMAGGYGKIVAAEYGEAGNFIKSQIKSLSEVGPSKSFMFLPAPAATSLKVSVNGVVSTLAMSAPNIATGAGCATQFASLAGAVSGLTVSASPVKAAVAAPITVQSLSAAGDVLTLTAAITDSFAAGMVAGDVVVIPESSALAGALDQNAGVYEVVEWDAASVSLRQIKHWVGGDEVAPVAFDVTGPVAAVSTADIAGFAPVTVEASAPAVAGTASTIELSSATGSVSAAGNMLDSAFLPVLSDSFVSIGSIGAVASGDQLTIQLSSASWASTPKAGDVVRIARTSALSGGMANVGLHVVVAATATSMVIKSAFGLAGASVASSVIADSQVIEKVAGFVSTSLAAKKIESAAEGKVWVEAVNVQTGTSFPTTQIGGTSFIEVGFNDGSAAACTLTIDNTRTLTIAPAGGSPIVAKLGKFKNLQNLVDWLNSQAGVSAKVVDARSKTLPTSVLDAVSSVGVMANFSSASRPGKIKGDFYSFKKFMDDNFGLIAFAQGSVRAGLPASESVASFLSGAVVGGSSDADMQTGLDESLKINVRMVVPLFSRDAQKDIEDGMTDPSSSYSIASINAAVRSNVATASTVKVRRERFGSVSIHSSFADAKIAAAEMAYERTQMTFQLFRAVDGNGALQWFLPWMGACAVAAGRAQAVLGTPMLRKTFAFSAIKHIGDQSVFSDTLAQDFDPEDMGMMEEAIEAGLLTFKAVDGFGIRVESPDLSTRSRENDPEGWVWERVNVLFTLDEVLQTSRTTLENFIGSRQSDVSLAVVKEAINKVLLPFVTSGALLNAVVDSVVREGTGYRAQVRVIPAEALEWIALDVLAERAS
jgi:hypothetical protein